MTTLTLARLAEIEAAAAKATPGPYSDGKTIPFRAWSCEQRGFSIAFVSGGQAEEADANATYIALCDPATVAALCRDARRYVWLRDNATPPTLASIAWGHSKSACEFSDPDDAIDAAIRAAGLLE